MHVPGKGHLTEFGLDVGAFSLRWFEEYYGIKYPSDKVDLVALPDFSAGAMENLGCITFRENLLLLDPATSTQNEREVVADVVSHELAHMWFGDLVTMRWWNGIWLNEAFATFMEIAACDAYRPDWERWTSFGLERTVAFETDSLASTRPVEFEVRSPADCEGMFDVLTYQKGGALLRMLEQYLGVDRFRAGVSHYLRTHSYANTETNDLWDAIEATSGEPVRRIMDSWIWQPGYPIVSASLDRHRRRLAGAVAVPAAVPLRRPDELGRATSPSGRSRCTSATAASPRRCCSTAPRSPRRSRSPIPTGRSSSTPAATASTASTTPTSCATGSTREVLASMTTLERYNLVDDAWSSTLAGRLSAVELLEFLDGFRDEPDHAVWQAMAIALRGLGRIVDEDATEAFQARVRSLVVPALERAR